MNLRFIKGQIDDGQEPKVNFNINNLKPRIYD
jgi:hypothetical protein